MLRGINKQDIFEDDGIGGDSPRMSSGQKMDHENRPHFSGIQYKTPLDVNSLIEFKFIIPIK